MKKAIISVLVLVILGGFFFVFSTYYTNKKIDEFFHHNDGTLYSSAGLKWSLTDAKTSFFGGKYQTELSVYGERVLTLEHEAVFGTRFDSFNVGSIETKGKFAAIEGFPDLSDKEFDIRSKVAFNGIGSTLFMKSGNASGYDEYSGVNEDLAWGDIKADFFISFKKDFLKLDAYIPLIKIDDSNGNFFYIEEQRYQSRSDKKTGLWLGDSDISISKIDAHSETDEFFLSNLKFKTNVKADKDATLTNINKISFDKLIYRNYYLGDDVSLSDIIFNVNFENLDAKSIRNMLETIGDIDPTNYEESLSVYVSLFGYISDILDKQPKIVVEELSGKYSNQSGKISGFAQYMGDGDSSIPDFLMKADFEISKKLVEEIFRTKYKSYSSYDYGYDMDDEAEYDTEYDELNGVEEEYKKFDIENQVYLEIENFENSLGIEEKEGVYKGTLEYKNGGFLVNGKPYEAGMYDDF